MPPIFLYSSPAITAALRRFGRIMVERSYLVAASAAVKKRAFLRTLRPRTIMVVAIYIAVIACASREFLDPRRPEPVQRRYFPEHAVPGIHPGRWPCDNRPVNLDVPPLYILLLGAFAPALWLMVRQAELDIGCLDRRISCRPASADFVSERTHRGAGGLSAVVAAMRQRKAAGGQVDPQPVSAPGSQCIQSLYLKSLCMVTIAPHVRELSRVPSSGNIRGSF